MDFIQDVSERFDEAMRHEQYPFARIAADYGYTPEMAFAYQLGMVTRYIENGHEVSQRAEGFHQPATGSAL